MRYEKYLVMFSSGRTSAFLAKLAKEHPVYKDAIFIFVNTGKEREESLIFANECDKRFKLNLIWLEAKVNFEKGKSTSYKVVDFKSASRNGEPFEQMLKKYPLPNNMASNCTRELKLRPVENFIKDNLKGFDVYRLIGIRADEAHRKSLNFEKEKMIYPLCDEFKVDKTFIRKWWDKQDFDLNLKDYEGNCDLCFKKSLKKRLTIIKDNPKIAVWWEEMEEKYKSEAIPRFDLRTNKSVTELKKLANQPFKEAKDLHQLTRNQIDLFDFEIDCFCKST